MLDEPQIIQTVARPAAILRLTVPRTVAQTIYHGPYEGLGSAWGEFDSWIVARGHPRAPWECCLAGPEANPDPATYRTELNRPLVR